MGNLVAAALVALFAAMFPAGEGPEDVTATVYFDYGRQDLGSAGRLLVEEVAAEARSENLNAALVIGHTDTVGPASDNLRTGQERADHVAALLVELGFDENQIRAISAGESAPAVKYDDDRRDPLNRRVEISFFRAD